MPFVKLTLAGSLTPRWFNIDAIAGWEAADDETKADTTAETILALFNMPDEGEIIIETPERVADLVVAAEQRANAR